MKRIALLVFVLVIVAACMGQPAPEPGRTMYVCGVDRCRDSDFYGELILEGGINVWRQPDPDRGGVRYSVAHHDEIIVVEQRRVSEEPGGLWYRLRGGGWIDDYFVTTSPCGSHNLERYSFQSCERGEY